MESLIHSWIKNFLTTDPPRSKSLVITILGDSIAPHGGSVWLGSLIELLAPFGVNERLVRSSVFRLAEQGWIEAERRGRRSEYSLTPSGIRRFEQAYRKIYSHREESWDGAWTVVFAGPAEFSADERTKLKHELLWEGYRLLGPMSFVRPRADTEALSDILERTAARDKVIVCAARHVDPLLGCPMERIVPKLWDLSAVEGDYRRFITRFQKLAGFLDASEELDPALFFTVRTILIHAFRRVVLNDPLLPAELLPRQWQGAAAYALCRSIYIQCNEGAEEHLANVLGREGTPVTVAADYFYQRFGGLEQPARRRKIV